MPSLALADPQCCAPQGLSHIAVVQQSSYVGGPAVCARVRRPDWARRAILFLSKPSTAFAFAAPHKPNLALLSCHSMLGLFALTLRLAYALLGGQVVSWAIPALAAAASETDVVGF